MSDAVEQVRRTQADDGRPSAELIEEYRQGPDRLRDALSGMDVESLRARPIEGMWSSLEVLCHLADCEQFLADRMKRTAGTDRPLLVGIDNSPYLEVFDYQHRDPELQLQLIDVTRRQAAEHLAVLPDEAWQRPAVHTETGLITLRQAMFHTLRHMDHHIATIADKRAALGV